MSTKNDVGSAVDGLTTTNRRIFGTFPRASGRPKPPALPVKKPVVPPKPKMLIKQEVCRTIVLADKEVGNYFEAFPVKRLEAMEIENQHYYDLAAPVRMESLEIYEDCEYATIGEPRPDVTNGGDEPEEELYDDTSIPKTILRRQNSNNRDLESTEESLSDEDNPDADYYTLQKYKNQSRASWIERVESMSNKDIVKVKKRPLDRLISNQWNSQENDDDDEIDVNVSSKETMDLRLATIKDIIKDEKSYADKLKKMAEYSRLVSSCAPPVKRDLELTLEVVSNLLYLHKTFSNDLQKAVTNGEQTVGKLIERFVQEEFIQAKEYTNKYRNINTLQKLSPAIEVSIQKKKDEPVEVGDSKFPEDSRQESLQSFLTSLSLPIWRFQMCIHHLKRVIKYTPHAHPDYDHLQRALHGAKNFFSDLSTSSSQDIPLRHLVKKGLVVVQVENERKLRHLLLFNDVIICAKQRISNKMVVQWFIPLRQLTIDDRLSAQEDQGKASKGRTDSLKRSLIKYQSEYTNEFKKTCFVEKNKKLEIIKKKLMELETELVLNTPYLRLVLISSSLPTLKKQYTILLSSDYERAAWKNSILNFVNKSKPNDCKMTLAQANILINDLKLSPPVSHDDVFQSTRIDGQLKLTIHKFLGLQAASKIFCSVEVDSFGHFFLKAKTTKVMDLEPDWNEDFDIELEGANTLRIMCYQAGQGSDVHLGSTALELNEAWLKEKFCEESVPISTNMFLKISIEYTSHDEAIQASLAKVSFKGGNYFGAHLDGIAKVENNNVPLIIRSCVEEIEKRGMKDTGIYRVSGLSSEIQKLKMAFNKDSTTASTSLHGVDTNVLTGTIKLFLRELPDPLFPSSKYHEFIKCHLHSPTQEDNLRQLMAELPSPNLETIIFILQHLVRVADQETHNKMSLGNLATIFGPNLMKNPSPLVNSCHDLFLSSSTTDITHQCKIVLKLLTMVAEGCTFARL